MMLFPNHGGSAAQLRALMDAGAGAGTVVQASRRVSGFGKNTASRILVMARTDACARAAPTTASRSLAVTRRSDSTGEPCPAKPSSSALGTSPTRKPRTDSSV